MEFLPAFVKISVFPGIITITNIPNITDIGMLTALVIMPVIMSPVQV
jgi:hypothetical protein